MISFVAVLVLSFATLWVGTYVADRLEHRCASCAKILASEHPLEQ